MITCALALAAVVALARPAAAQVNCSAGEGGILCGTVWNDLDGDGIQDAGEPGIGGVKVVVYDSDGNPVPGAEFYTNPDGTYSFDSQTLPPGTYTIFIDSTQPPLGAGFVASPSDVGSDEFDSDGSDSGVGTSTYEITISDTFTVNDVDFGFHAAVASQPGTGTPGYWKNHPSAWPSPYQSGVTVGGVFYSKDDALKIFAKPGKDKRATMFTSLVSAMLNVAAGNDSSCVASTIALADAWMTTYGVPNTDPIVTGSSVAWVGGDPTGESLHKLMDAYNNGLLCAPHRN
jgi:hypothetical protein